MTTRKDRTLNRTFEQLEHRSLLSAAGLIAIDASDFRPHVFRALPAIANIVEVRRTIDQPAGRGISQQASHQVERPKNSHPAARQTQPKAILLIPQVESKRRNPPTAPVSPGGARPPQEIAITPPAAIVFQPDRSPTFTPATLTPPPFLPASLRLDSLAPATDSPDRSTPESRRVGENSRDNIQTTSTPVVTRLQAINSPLPSPQVNHSEIATVVRSFATPTLDDNASLSRPNSAPPITRAFTKPDLLLFDTSSYSSIFGQVDTPWQSDGDSEDRFGGLITLGESVNLELTLPTIRSTESPVAGNDTSISNADSGQAGTALLDLEDVLDGEQIAARRASSDDAATELAENPRHEARSESTEQFASTTEPIDDPNELEFGGPVEISSSDVMPNTSNAALLEILADREIEVGVVTHVAPLLELQEPAESDSEEEAISASRPIEVTAPNPVTATILLPFWLTRAKRPAPKDNQRSNKNAEPGRAVAKKQGPQN